MGIQNFNLMVDCPSMNTYLPFLQKLSREALQHLEEDVQTKICFAVNEGLINALRYSDDEANMTFAINKNNDYIEFIIKNYGEEISNLVLEDITSRSFDDILWEENGRGFLIINEIIDEWSFCRDEKGRNVLNMKMNMTGEKIYV
ncbi:MAG TPA: ATP-binding protein [Bacillus bacterium]|nr:ATP-binding protein [Bacillus sp. (in: firmicutes)]